MALSVDVWRTRRRNAACGCRCNRASSHLVLPWITFALFGTALGVCIYVESVFNLPGLGHRMVDSTALGVLDMPLMIGVIFVSAVTILALNLLIDLTYSLIDSRITRVSSRMADVPVRRVA